MRMSLYFLRKELKKMARRDEEFEEEEEEQEEELSIAELIEKNIRGLIEQRSKYPATSEEYCVLSERIKDETENLRNMKEAEESAAQTDCALRNKNTALYQTLGTIAGNIAGQTIGAMINRRNVHDVLGYENEGGIVNSYASKKMIK